MIIKVVNAIDALYNSPDSAIRTEANELLMNVEQSEDGWQMAQVLLTHSSFEVQYFGVHLLYSKCHNQLLSMNISQRQWVDETVSKVLMTPVHTILQHKLCSVKALLVSVPSDIQRYIETSLALQQQSGLLVVLLLLNALGEHISSHIGFSEAERKSLTIAVHENELPIQLLIMQCLDTVNVPEEDILMAILKLILSWKLIYNDDDDNNNNNNQNINNQNSKQYFQSKLITKLCHLLSLDTLSTTIIQKICDVFMNIIEIQSDIMYPLGEVLGSLSQTYIKKQQNNDILYCTSISELTSCYIEYYIDIINQTQSLFTVFELLLCCTMHPNKASCEASLEGWHSLQDIPLEERAPQLGYELMKRVFIELLRQAAYPDGFIDWYGYSDIYDLDEEQFKRFRIILEDTFIMLYHTHHHNFLSVLCEFLNEHNPWQNKEVALYVLCVISDEMKQIYNVIERKNDTELICNIVASRLTINNNNHQQNDNTLYTSMMITFIGKYAFLFNIKPILLEPSVNKIIEHIKQSPKSAGKAFLDLCRANEDYLKQHNILESLILLVLNKINVHLNNEVQECRYHIWTGVCELINSAYPVSNKFIQIMYDHILQALSAYLQSSNAQQQSSFISSRTLVSCSSELHCLRILLSTHDHSDSSIVQIINHFMNNVASQRNIIIMSGEVAEEINYILIHIIRLLQVQSLNYFNIISDIILLHITEYESSLSLTVMKQLITLIPPNHVQLLQLCDSYYTRILSTSVGICDTDGKIMIADPEFIINLFTLISCAIELHPQLIIKQLNYLGPFILKALYAINQRRLASCIMKLIHALYTLLASSTTQQLQVEEKQQLLLFIEMMEPQVVDILLCDIAGLSPRTLVPVMFSILKRCLKRQTLHARQYINASLQNESFPVQLAQIDKKRFLCAMNNILKNSNNIMQFDALLVDFSSICRGQQSSDCLADYFQH